MTKRYGIVVAIVGVVVTSACDRNTPITTPSALSTSPISKLIEGRIEALNAPNRLSVAGFAIQLEPQVSIRSGSMAISFADLRLGALTRVTAFSDDAAIRGTLVDVLDIVGAPTHLRGAIAGMSGDGNAFQFTIGNQLVRGNNATATFAGTRPLAVASLRDGAAADVDGLQRADYVYATNVTLSEGDSPSSTPSPSPSPSPNPPTTPSPSPGLVTIGGSVGNLSGACPVLLFTVNGSVVVTDNSTHWTGGVCTTLAPGASVSATGTQNGDTLVAREVTIN